MRPYFRRGADPWALVIITGNTRWWGLCRAGRETYLDLGRWRVARRNAWTPLFTEPRTFGPVQWWTSPGWNKQ